MKIWDPHQEQRFTAVRGRGGFSWSPDGRHLATHRNTDSDEQRAALQIVDMDSLTSQRFAFPSSDRYQIIAWSPDGSRIAVGVGPTFEECVAKVFDRVTLSEIYSLETPRQTHSRNARSIAWSPDARYLATGDLGSARICEHLGHVNRRRSDEAPA